MADTLKSASVTAGTNATTLYTCPSGTTAVVKSVQLANTTTNTATVTVEFYKATGATTKVLAKSVPVFIGSAEEALTRDKVLEAGDILKVTASATSTVDAVAAVLEIT